MLQVFHDYLQMFNNYCSSTNSKLKIYKALSVTTKKHYYKQQCEIN